MGIGTTGRLIWKLSHTDCLFRQRVGTQTSAALKYVILFALILAVLVGVALGLKYALHFGSRWQAARLPGCLPTPAPARFCSHRLWFEEI